MLQGNLLSLYTVTTEEGRKEKWILLSSRRKIADETNKRELEKLDAEEHIFQAQLKGNFPVKNFPTELALRLRVGAQVMFIRNDVEKK